MNKEFGKLAEEQCIRCNKKATHFVRIFSFLFGGSYRMYCEKHYFERLNEEGWK